MFGIAYESRILAGVIYRLLLYLSFCTNIIHRSVVRCQCEKDRSIIWCMKDNIRLRFAEKIKKVRKLRGYTQDRLSKTRTVPLTSDAVEMLRSMPRSHTYKNVFLRAGKPIDKGAEKNLRYWLQKIAKAAGIAGMTRLHELRHTCGQQIYDLTGDIYVVKEVLGHSDLKTTLRYVGKATRRAEEAMKKLEGFGTK